jgi:hypothetical protein
MNSKTAAAAGLANKTRKVCSSATPVRPTGIVAKMIIQASRWSLSATASRGRRCCRLSRALAGRLRKKPRMILIQSARKNHISARAVAQCNATM